MISLFGKHPLIVGFVIGYAPPLYYAVDRMHHELTYVASRPPNTVGCGMGMLWAWIMILCIGPVTGAMGAAIGYACCSHPQKEIPQQSP